MKDGRIIRRIHIGVLRDSFCCTHSYWVASRRQECSNSEEKGRMYMEDKRQA
jgi:hypothetical protein